MRFYSNRLSQEEEDALTVMSEEYPTAGHDFLHDLYVWARKQYAPVPTKPQIEQFVNKVIHSVLEKMNMKIALNRRAYLFNQFENKGYLYIDPAVVPKSDRPLKVFELMQEVMLMLLEAESKRRKAQCSSCPHLTKCEYGRNIGVKLQSPADRVVRQYLDKLHPDCPDKPTMDMLDNMYSAMQNVVQQMHQQQQQAQQQQKPPKGVTPAQQPPQGGPPAPSQGGQMPSPPMTSNSSSDPWDENMPIELDDQSQTFGNEGQGKGRARYKGRTQLEVDKDSIKRMSNQHMLIDQLAQKIGNFMPTGHSRQYKKTSSIDDHKETGTIDGMEEIKNLKGKEAALPEDLQDKRILQRQAATKDNQTPVKKQRKLLYMQDISGSMDCIPAAGALGINDWYGGVNHDILVATRLSIASAFGISLLRKTHKEGGSFSLCFFSSGRDNYYSVEDEGWTKLEQRMFTIASSGGTNIGQSFREAVEYMDKEAKKFPDGIFPDILIATDCEDSSIYQPLDPQTEALMKKNKIQFSVLLISGKRPPDSGWIKDHAEHFYHTDASALNLEKLTKLAW